MRSTAVPTVAFLAAVLSGCPGAPTPTEVEILTPEPTGAPSESADGRLICLGVNEPPDARGSTLTLPGWVRTFADPTNSGGAQPAMRAEAFDPSGVSIGTAFSDTGNGRVLISVPVRPAGFEGWVSVHADGFLDVTIFSSRRYTNTAVAGWVWLPTVEERDAAAAAASVALEPGTGILIGAVHDCDVFGTANAVIRHGASTDGVVYFNGFDPDPALTFTDASGRFAIPNLAPGSLVVDAFGRLMPGEPLTLLSHAEVTISADQITAIDLQPRAGLDR